VTVERREHAQEPERETRPAKVVTHLPDGTTQEAICAPDDYVLVCGPRRYVAAEQHYGNGTVALTLKLEREEALGG
jgi:hypothetical protein